MHPSILDLQPNDIKDIKNSNSVSISVSSISSVSSGDSEKPPKPLLPIHCALPESERGRLLAIASLAAAIAPLATTTYYPAVNALARDLNVSITQINLTISVYQIFQGLAPSFTAAISDKYGRRPVYLACLLINILVSLGLALQKNFVALMVLRCLQSGSSSGTSSLGNAVLDDLTTSDQRGRYLAYLSIGYMMGPSIGPVIGGLLAQYQGWRAIFWFLMIFGCVFLIISIVVLRETNRSIVGDGSVAPQKWNRSLTQIIWKDDLSPNHESLAPARHVVTPFRSLIFLRNKENLIICIYNGVLFAGYASVIGIFASQVHERYSYNEVQIGLCFLPTGAGTLLSKWTISKLIDWNYQREADKQGFVVEKNRRPDMFNFNVEKARLIIPLPLTLAMCALVVLYGWLMESRAHIAAILVLMFLLAQMMTSILISITAFLCDINPGNGATLGAAMTLTRSLLAAAGVAAATPIINSIGIGYTFTIMAGVWAATLPGLWIVYKYGHAWRKDSAV